MIWQLQNGQTSGLALSTLEDFPFSMVPAKDPFTPGPSFQAFSEMTAAEMSRSGHEETPGIRE
jgi:hypothetical protein